MNLSLLLEDQINNKLPVVLFCKPGSQEITCWADNTLYTEENNFKFIIKAFNPSSKLHGLRADIEIFTPIDNHCPLNSIAGKEEEPSEQYTRMLQEAIQQMSLGKMSKIVLSRVIEFPLNPSTNIVNALKQLCLLYPTAFNYLLYHPALGIWMGASPEILVQKINGQYKTMALAGSRQSHTKAKWGEKEIAEHDFVVDYIEDTLNSKAHANMEKGDRETVIAGDVEHLRTDFKFTSTESIQQIATALHPTPAVCGTPPEKAFEQIPSLEGYDRELYTGYLGPLADENESLYVNLRCMQIKDNIAMIYVGGGITVDSQIDQEWKETQMKSETLLKVMRNL